MSKPLTSDGKCELCKDTGWWASGGPEGYENIDRCPFGCALVEIPPPCEHPKARLTHPMDGNYGAGSQWCKDCGASRSDWSSWTKGCVMCKGAGYLYGRIPCPLCALRREEEEKQRLISEALVEQAKEGMV